MKIRLVAGMPRALALAVFGSLLAVGTLAAAELTPPKAGKPEILPLAQVKPGMQAIAWTVFKGNTPEPVPVEIIGVWQNAMGPRQHVIVANMGGKAKLTGVAGGMSGSPVYVDGKLIGAVALRLSAFSTEAICGITPIESMLEIKELDKSVPGGARTPDKAGSSVRASVEAQGEMPSEMVSRLVSAGVQTSLPSGVPMLTRSQPSGPVSRMSTPASSSRCHVWCRSANRPNMMKLASLAATWNPWSVSQSARRSRSWRMSATCACSAAAWASATRATACVTVLR